MTILTMVSVLNSITKIKRRVLMYLSSTERNASSRSNPTTLNCAEKRKKSEIGSDDDQTRNACVWNPRKLEGRNWSMDHKMKGSPSKCLVCNFQLYIFHPSIGAINHSPCFIVWNPQRREAREDSFTCKARALSFSALIIRQGCSWPHSSSPSVCCCGGMEGHEGSLFRLRPDFFILTFCSGERG